MGGTGRGDYTSLIEAFKDVVAGAAILRPAGGTDPVYCIGEDPTAAADAADAQAVDDQFSAAELGELVAWPDAKNGKGLRGSSARRCRPVRRIGIRSRGNDRPDPDRSRRAVGPRRAIELAAKPRVRSKPGPAPVFPKTGQSSRSIGRDEPRLRRLPFEWEALSIFRRPSRFWRTPLGNCWRSRP